MRARRARPIATCLAALAICALMSGCGRGQSPPSNALGLGDVGLAASVPVEISSADLDRFGLFSAIQALHPDETHDDAVRRALDYCARRTNGQDLTQAAFGAAGDSQGYLRTTSAFALYAANLYCPEFSPLR